MAKIEVTVAADEMQAWARVLRDPQEPPPSREEMMAEIGAKGIVHGIDALAVEDARTGPPGRDVLVAKGDPREIGKDAEVKFFVDLREMRPEEREDGSVDHRELGLVKNVVKGQVIAEKVPMRPGREGRTVKGKVLPVRQVVDRRLEGGANTAVTKDGLKLVALVDGHAYIDRERRLAVSDTFTLNRSVDMSTGNIRTNGHCVIRGAVHDGFVVEAKGNVEIHGEVEGAQITSHGGDVTIRLGVHGHIKGEIRAKGTIRAKFIENCRLVEADEIVVDEHVLHSRVVARRRLQVEGRPGLICGGEVKAVLSITCLELGAPAYTKTSVWIGDFTALPLYARISELKKQIYDLEVEAGPAKAALEELKTLVQRTDQLAVQRKEALAPVADAAKHLLPRIEGLKKEREQVEAMIPRLPEEPSLAVLGKVHPGVTIHAVRGPEVEEIEISKESSRRRWIVGEKGVKVKDLKPGA